jgi:hypothetical protein
MFIISEQQIEFILNDIRRNGVEMEDLQLNLLDHICCIIEQELDENGDFEQFYFASIKRFYKHRLSEIEEETISLLTFKNYYAMKKIMLLSGITSVSLLTIGLFLKFLHQPGAAVCIVLGITIMSLVFLPLMFTLKIKEEKEVKNKVVIGLGTLSGILLSIGILFKLMHWPGANALSLFSLIILLVLFLPVYFFTGIRNPETKLNTITSSLLIITGCGLFLTLVRSPKGSKQMYVQITKNYMRNEQLLQNERELFLVDNNKDSSHLTTSVLSDKINTLCEELKSFILVCETGQKNLSNDFEKESGLLGETYISSFIHDDPQANERLDNLKQLVNDYNKTIPGKKMLPVQSIILENDEFRTADALNSLVQIQMYVFQNQRTERE